ncbi:MAG TPA: DedA family protein [Nocardioides sp.]|nr:DedA family protein [Nocardioides sp.]
MTGLLDQLLATPAWLVLLVVFALPALESSAFLGFLFPGETAVLLGGVAAGQGHVPLAAVVAAGVGGAILGDAVGFLVGRRWGRRVLDSTMGRFVNARHLDRAEGALRRRGVWAVFLGRFTAALRVMIPGLAGMAGMHPRRFLGANIAGGAVWGGLVATAGYLAGNNWHTVEHYLTGAGLALTGGVVALLVSAHVLGPLLRRAARRVRTLRRSRSGWLGRVAPVVAPAVREDSARA